MTINELIYNIRGQIKQSRPDDLQISDRQLEFMINYIREKLIVQQLQKGRSISSNIKQDLGQVPVELVDKAEGDLKVNKLIFRTIDKIPQPIELDHTDLITYVGGLDKHSGYPFKTKANARWNTYNKYASKEPLSYYNSEHIYITNCSNPNLEFINIEGVFNNPRDVYKFKNPNGTPCYNPDLDNYPISGRMIDMLNDIIKTKELNIFLQIAEDSTNNADVKS